MALTTAQKNKRKRERKKRERAAERLEQEEQAAKKAKTGFEVSESEAVKNNNNENEDVEIEYVAEPLFPSAANDGVNKEGAAADSSNAPSAIGANNANADDEDDGQDINAVMRRFQNRAAVIYVTDEDNTTNNNADSTSNKNIDNLQDDENGDENNNHLTSLSKRKLKDKLRPTVAQLKQTVRHPELVEAHDVTAPDPQFLVYLKGISGTVPVPRHWGRKRKYLQGKRGVEKPPFALPDFIIRRGYVTYAMPLPRMNRKCP